MTLDPGIGAPEVGVPEVGAGDVPGVDVPGEDVAGVDVAAVVAEIEAEAERRRAAGGPEVDQERRLDEMFDRYAPPAPRPDDLGALLARAEAASVIDVDVPTASSMPGASVAKRGLARLMAWFVRYVAQQVSASSGATVAVLRALARRIEALEQVVPVAAPPVDTVLAAGRERASQVAGAWADDVVESLRSTSGRVAVVELGDGLLLERLTAAGVDAYGIDPDPAPVAAAVARGLEARSGDAVDHLERVAAGGLDGVVLAGCVERLPVGALVRLTVAAAAALAPGGRLLVVSATPAAFAAGASPVESDLAPGRPLHAETWTALVEAQGPSVVAVRQQGAGRDEGVLLVAERRP